MTMITNTFTQRGVPGGDSRSGLMGVSSPVALLALGEGGRSAMGVSSSVARGCQA
ncbi:MAG TPA: hypothetical protein VEC96_01315 [Anaerolineae bacterium]|nr:hypothetical protein [Anaerolineae bacterium]